MRVAVTGAHGFVGSWLGPELEHAGHEVICFDRADGDLSDPDTAALLIDRAKPDCLVHLAAKYGRLHGEIDPAYTVQQNAQVTTSVARACGEAGVRLVYMSSSEVYGDLGELTVNEYDLYAAEPHNLYGLSKRWGEEVCRLYAPDGLLICRLSMPYGPRQAVGYGRCALTTMIWQALERRPLTIHQGTERSWMHVSDAAQAVTMLIERAEGVFNVCRDDDQRSMLDVATLVCRLTDAPDSLIREVPVPPMQTAIKRISADRLRDIGFQPRTALEHGIATTASWAASAPVVVSVAP
jgi:nucleoside-diphosphate-sugar epimerase